MLLKVTIVREFNTSEASDRLAFARHLANQGIRNISPGADMRQEVQTDAEGNPQIVSVPYCVLLDDASKAVLSEMPFSSPEISDAMRFYGEMPGYLARVWVSRENKEAGVDADGNPKAPKGGGKRGRKSNAEREKLAQEAAKAAAENGTSVPETAEQILAAAVAAQNASANGSGEKVKAGKAGK